MLDASQLGSVPPRDLEQRAKDPLTKEEINSVAEKIAGSWEEFALSLDPEKFDINWCHQMRSTHHRPVMQATETLQKWSDDFATEAARRKLIEVLCGRGHGAVASDVFGDDLVDHVSQW